MTWKDFRDEHDIHLLGVIKMARQADTAEYRRIYDRCRKRMAKAKKEAKQC
jgi:hypothetical protein